MVLSTSVLHEGIYMYHNILMVLCKTAVSLKALSGTKPSLCVYNDGLAQGYENSIAVTIVLCQTIHISMA